jgi:hypothetical protein
MNYEPITMNQFKTYTGVISKDLFQVSLVTYLILLLLETIKTGFVTFFFDLNILLWITLVSGILMVLTYKEETKITSSEIGKRAWNYFFTSMKGRWGKDAKWNFLFKEVRAKELVDTNRYMYKEWYAHIKELEAKQLAQSNLSFLLRDISLKRLIDRDWTSFSHVVKTTPNISERDFYYILLLSLGGGALVFYKTESLGKLSIFLSLLSFVIVFLLSFLIFTEEEKP